MFTLTQESDRLVQRPVLAWMGYVCTGTGGGRRWWEGVLGVGSGCFGVEESCCNLLTYPGYSAGQSDCDWAVSMMCGYEQYEADYFCCFN